MNDDATLQQLTAADLVRLAGEAAAAPCAQCRSIGGAGWETASTTLDEALLRRVGTLRDSAIDEPTLHEHHPGGTHYWSPDAPIAPRHFPYNRCDVWQCRRCGRAWLRYTEYGGYYVDPRIRALDAARVVDAA